MRAPHMLDDVGKFFVGSFSRFVCFDEQHVWLQAPLTGSNSCRSLIHSPSACRRSLGVMPELPEVEQFRRILLPLVSHPSSPHGLEVELARDNPPRKWLSADDVQAITRTYFCADVLRKGKLICMVLRAMSGSDAPKSSKAKAASAPDGNVKYLYLHMGMTGRIATPGKACRFLEGVKDDDGTVFPPSHTYLLLKAGPYQVAFSDPRKFGSAILSDDTAAMDALAPDALHTLQSAQSDPSVLVETILPKLEQKSMAIKPLLMDQKRVLAGVGNWVADEVLYQCEMHPDQNFLSTEQAQSLCDALFRILSTAVDRLDSDQEFPEEWLFHYRWTNKKAAKDHKGRSLTFVVRLARSVSRFETGFTGCSHFVFVQTSGGRTSAIVASMQKLKKQQSNAGRKKVAAAANSRKVKTEEAVDSAAPDEKNGSATPTSKPKAASKARQTATKRKEAAAASVDDGPVRRKSPRVAKK
jgi:formamidopyrimidine-DNA glycosylase